MAGRIAPPPAFACFFYAAVLIYGAAGSPTPDNPGWPELLIAVFLLLSVGVAGVRDAFSFSKSASPFLQAMRFLFFMGLVFPLLVGAWHGNDRGLMLRDMAAFLFLGLPLFLSARIAADNAARFWMAPVFILAGFFFAVRTLMPAFNVWIPDGELLYLSNSPLTLFAGLCLAAALWRYLQPPFAPLRYGRAAFSGAMLCVILAAMLLDVQRATIGAVLVTLCVLMLDGIMRTPRRAILPVVIIIACACIIYPLLDGILQAMAAKTAAVGLNARSAEAAAVLEAVRGSPGGFFTGLGWGAVFGSPAVAGLEVNYTHSLLTTLFLKGGLIVLVPALIMAVCAFYEIFLIFQKDRGRGLALFWPFAIPLLLYASHKSLDYGLLLLALGVWSVGLRTLPEADPSVTKKTILQPAV